MESAEEEEPAASTMAKAWQQGTKTNIVEGTKARIDEQGGSLMDLRDPH